MSYKMVDMNLASNELERRTLAMFKAMEDGTLPDAIKAYCTDDFTWANSGLPTLTGQAAIFEHMAAGGYSALIPVIANMTHFSADVLSIASNENIVFTERIDHHWDKDGRDLMTPHIAGVMEFRGDKICALRDFYDIACYGQVPTTPEPRYALPA